VKNETSEPVQEKKKNKKKKGKKNKGSVDPEPVVEEEPEVVGEEKPVPVAPIVEPPTTAVQNNDEFSDEEF